MDDISALIKEAKPLYFARKKRTTASRRLCVRWFCCSVSEVFIRKARVTR